MADELRPPSDPAPPVSEERRAELAPKLRALLADFAKLSELERPELEPAPTWPWEAGDDEQR